MKINLNQILEKKGKTMYWLAEQTGIGYPNIFNLSKGKTTSVKFEVLELICNALECSPNDILIIEKR
ncbi:MAG: helix-turn-helix transcriptional regulator [Bacillota bacterium]|nr:helix-turn-helix transcriptional regulator [Bacillota bacterium]